MEITSFFINNRTDDLLCIKLSLNMLTIEAKGFLNLLILRVLITEESLSVPSLSVLATFSKLQVVLVTALINDLEVFSSASDKVVFPKTIN